MEGYNVKNMLREALEELFSVEEGKKAKNRYKKNKKDKDKDSKGSSKKASSSGKKDYSDVRRAFEKLGGPSMVDVMILTGIPDDEKGVNRSLFRKKVKQIKNKDTGSYYQFDDEELNKVRAALDVKS